MESYKEGQRLEYKPTQDIYEIFKIMDETVYLTKENDLIRAWYLEDIKALSINYNLI